MKLKRSALGVAAAAMLLTLATGPALAADSHMDRPVPGAQKAGTHTTEAQPTLKEVRAVADRLWAGQPTRADEEFLKSHRDIAAGLPDGRTIELGVAVSTSAKVTAAQSPVTARCHWADRYMNVFSPTGSRLYSYHSVLDSWCEKGASISSSKFHDYFSGINGGAMTNPRTGRIHELRKPTANHWVAYTGGSIDNCIFKFGCLGTKYPALQISHYAGKGSLTYQWYNKDDGSGWHHE